MTMRDFWASSWIPKSAETPVYCALAAFTLLIAPTISVGAVDRASSEQCSNPDFVLESFRTEESSSAAKSGLHIVGDNVAAVSTVEISSPCGEYLSNFVGSTYTFSTGVKIGPNRASDGLEASRIDLLSRKAMKGENNRMYFSEERIATAGDGRSVDLILSSRDGRSEVSIVTAGSAGVTSRSVLLSSDTAIRSVGWIASIHGEQGGLYILEENSGLLGHIFVYEIDAAFGEVKP